VGHIDILLLDFGKVSKLCIYQVEKCVYVCVFLCFVAKIVVHE
jgi:hypothetical protein